MSSNARFFIDKIDYPSVNEAYLEGDEFTHARTVLRAETGTELVLLDGSGKEFSAVVAKVEKTRLTAHITGVNVCDKEPKTEIYLLCGALKGDKTEFAVQKATELGVARIGIFHSEYCSAFINKNKLERLGKVAKEAAKQCRRACAPRVEYYDNLQSALNSAEVYNNKLFACEFLDNSEADMGKISGSTAVVVGSEGGFSEEEFKSAKSFGFYGISLGKRILRAETAAVAVCTLVAFSLGELK